jgi:hypothetical protein
MQFDTSRRRRKSSRHDLLEALESRTLLSAGPELWFYVQTNLATSANVTSTKALIDRAALAGYKYMMLADTKFGYDGIAHPGSGFNPSIHLANVANVIAYSKSKGITFVPASYELGRADWVLTQIDENLVEGQQVVGANFTVAANGTLTFNPQNPTLNNPSFPSSASWALDPGRAFIDTTTGHTDSSSLKIAAGGGRGLAIQNVTLIPHRQYHVSYWEKADANFSGDQFIKIYDAGQGKFLEDHEYEPALKYTGGGAWQQKDYVFNSGNSTNVQFRVGSWGSTTGNIWFDDVSLTEIALHNVVRNSSSPLKIYRANGTPLTEGVDVNQIKEPWVINSSTYQLYRTPLTVTIPAGSSLHAGDPVKIDYDAAQPVEAGQYSLSMAPEMQTYYHNVTTQLRTLFSAGTPMMVGGYDEIRAGNSSGAQIAAGKTAAQTLADSFLATYNTIRSVDPTTPIYTWSDMFDPNHNAVNNYYYWNGNLTPPPYALPSDVTVMNWNLGNLNTSLKYFAGLGNQQIIAGDYGAADGNAEAQLEVSRAVGAPGVRGLMFTVWDGNYSQLENYAAGAKAAWATYITPPTVSNVYVRGTGWSSSYLSSLVSAGLGDATYGYRIPTGSAQLKPFGWNNLNQVSITFNENVNITQNALTINGANVATYGITGFTYNAATKTATWTLATPLTGDAITLHLAGTGANAVKDTAGNYLDGNWTDGVSTVSGDGVSGGDFVFGFKTLSADTNGDNTVNFADFVSLSNNYGAANVGPGGGDFNGDGATNFADFVILSNNYGHTAPNFAAPGNQTVSADAAPTFAAASTTLTENPADPTPEPTTATAPVSVTATPISTTPPTPSSTVAPATTPPAAKPAAPVKTKPAGVTVKKPHVAKASAAKVTKHAVSPAVAWLLRKQYLERQAAYFAAIFAQFYRR